MVGRLAIRLINHRRHPLQGSRNQARKVHLPHIPVRHLHMARDSNQEHLRALVLTSRKRLEAARVVKPMQKGYMYRQQQVVVYQVQLKLSL